MEGPAPGPGRARRANETATRAPTLRLLRPGPSALLAAPALLWFAQGVYLPILAPGLDPAWRWAAALAIVALAALSLAAHGLAHLAAARRLGVALPSRLPLGVLGDGAQIWLPAGEPRREALVALAGPLASAALAAGAALLWAAQLAPGVDAVALFAVLCNGGLAALNLAPGYPFDGGRLVRLMLRGAVARPWRAPALAGWAIAGALLAWAGYIVSTRSRLSGETGAALLALAALIALGLAGRPLPEQPPGMLAGGQGLLRRALAVLLGPLLLAPALALVPMPHGLYAPGGAIAVAPMVEVSAIPPEPSAGALLLTTVVGQTPIFVAQWLVGQVDPAIMIVPPEQVVPPDTTPQELMAENVRMLDESEVVATVVALNLAGYDATLTGSGAYVTEVLPESLARGILLPGDMIVTLGGVAVRTSSDLLVALGGRDTATPVETVVVRGGETLRLALPLLPPAAPAGPPRIGITTTTAGLAVDAPVPVRIRPHSIIGGPSAGLMFTLAIYDRLTPGDLTGGQRVAGTGTISRDGRVGPIGGVAQKVAAAERAGAAYFLAPLENAADARRAARRITIIEVSSVEDALAALRGLPRAPANP